jgi:hypothetical protein
MMNFGNALLNSPESGESVLLVSGLGFRAAQVILQNRIAIRRRSFRQFILRRTFISRFVLVYQDVVARPRITEAQLTQ